MSLIDRRKLPGKKGPDVPAEGAPGVKTYDVWRDGRKVGTVTALTWKAALEEALSSGRGNWVSLKE